MIIAKFNVRHQQKDVAAANARIVELSSYFKSMKTVAVKDRGR